jgi:hypothetical protein
MKKFNKIEYFYNNEGIDLQHVSIIKTQSAYSLEYSVIGTINDFIPNITNNLVRNGSLHNKQLISTGNVRFNGQAAFNQPMQRNRIGLGFTNKNNAIIIYNNGSNASLSWGLIKRQLIQLWIDQNFTDILNNIFIVHSIINTQQAVVIHSNRSKTSITARLTDNAIITSPADLINIDLALIAGHTSVQVDRFDNATPLLFKLIRFDRRLNTFAPYSYSIPLLVRLILNQ